MPLLTVLILGFISSYSFCNLINIALYTGEITSTRAIVCGAITITTLAYILYLTIIGARTSSPANIEVKVNLKQHEEEEKAEE